MQVEMNELKSDIWKKAKRREGVSERETRLTNSDIANNNNTLRIVYPTTIVSVRGLSRCMNTLAGGVSEINVNK